MDQEGPGSGLDAEARRRVSLAVRAGDAVTDPADAPAAVELARLAQRRLEARTLPSALRISAGVVLTWLVLVALPVTISSGVHLAALAAGLGIGLLLFAVILLLGRRQLRLARRAELRNARLLDGGPVTRPDPVPGQGLRASGAASPPGSRRRRWRRGRSRRWVREGSRTRW